MLTDGDISQEVYMKTMKANEYFKQQEIDIKIDISELRSKFGQGQIRERHLAEMIRFEIKTSNKVQRN